MNSSDIDKITLTIEPEKETVRMESCSGGIYSSKLIELDDLSDCFLKSVARPAVHSGLLPPNCLSYSEGEKGWCSVTLLFPERRSDFIYHKTIYENLPLPQMVFRFSLYRGQRIQNVDVGIVEEGRLKMCIRDSTKDHVCQTGGSRAEGVPTHRQSSSAGNCSS